MQHLLELLPVKVGAAAVERDAAAHRRLRRQRDGRHWQVVKYAGAHRKRLGWTLCAFVCVRVWCVGSEQQFDEDRHWQLVSYARAHRKRLCTRGQRR